MFTVQNESLKAAVASVLAKVRKNRGLTVSTVDVLDMPVDGSNTFDNLDGKMTELNQNFG